MPLGISNQCKSLAIRILIILVNFSLISFFAIRNSIEFCKNFYLIKSNCNKVGSIGSDLRNKLR